MGRWEATPLPECIVHGVYVTFQSILAWPRATMRVCMWGALSAAPPTSTSPANPPHPNPQMSLLGAFANDTVNAVAAAIGPIVAPAANASVKAVAKAAAGGGLSSITLGWQAGVVIATLAIALVVMGFGKLFCGCAGFTGARGVVLVPRSDVRWSAAGSDRPCILNFLNQQTPWAPIWFSAGLPPSTWSPASSR